MKTRYLGKEKFQASALSRVYGNEFAYGGAEESQAINTIHAAVDMGVTFPDSAEVYGPFDNEVLVGKAIKGIRMMAQIATKFGFRILPTGHRDWSGWPASTAVRNIFASSAEVAAEAAEYRDHRSALSAPRRSGGAGGRRGGHHGRPG